METVTSEVDVLSQTDTEDRDTAESSDDSGTQLTDNTSGKSSNSSSTTHSSETSESSSSEQCVPQNVSVDFTEVTDLDENSVNFLENSRQSSRDTSRKGSLKQNAFTGLPELDFSSDWYNHKCFNRYWMHYRQCMEWCQKHYRTCEKLQNQFFHQQNICYAHQYSSPWQHPYYPSLSVSNQAEQSISQKKKTNRSRRSKRKPKHRKQKSSVSSITTSSASQDEFEMEITQDMIDFFAKSEEHRRQRGK